MIFHIMDWQDSSRRSLILCWKVLFGVYKY